MTWNENALVYGMNGFTAISQLNSWTPWNSSSQSWAVGQPSVTAVSPRHAIMRGDGMGDPGAKNTVNGMQVWFVTEGQQLVTATVAGTYLQNPPGGYTGSDGTDYFTILIFRPGCIWGRSVRCWSAPCRSIRRSFSRRASSPRR